MSHFVSEIIILPSTTTPTGFHLCDGALLSRTMYADLFAAIGTTFGDGDGSTTFGIPDLQGRVAMGASGSHALAEAGGAEMITLDASEIPGHVHDVGVTTNVSNAAATVAAPNGNYPAKDPTGGSQSMYDTAPTAGKHFASGFISVSESVFGGGDPHDNMQPYLTLNYFIAITGDSL